MSVQWKGDEFMERLRDAIDKGTTAAAIALESEIRGSFGSNHGGVPSKPGEFPNSQFGELRNSMGHTKAVDGVAFVGTGLDYGRYLNNGAVIKPQGKALVIPLTWEAKRLMVRVGGSARRAINQLKYSSRKMRMVRTEKGLLVVQDVAGKNARGIAWFLITRKTIEIQPRPWGPLGVAMAQDAMREAFTNTVQEAMK